MLRSGDRVYLDSSALVKLVIDEAESVALGRYLSAPLVLASSALARVEVVRAARLRSSAAVERAESLLHAMYLVALDDDLLDTAANLMLPALRSLDAIHLAAAITLRSRLSALVTYDQRMARAARELGLVVAAPGTHAG